MIEFPVTATECAEGGYYDLTVGDPKMPFVLLKSFTLSEIMNVADAMVRIVGQIEAKRRADAPRIITTNGGLTITGSVTDEFKDLNVKKFTRQ